MEPFLMHRFHGSRAGETPNEITVVVPAHAQGYDIYHKVSAYGRKADKYQQSYDDRESAYTPLEHVMKSQVSVDEIAAGGAAGKAFIEGGSLCVLNPGGLDVTVCSAQGTTLFTGNDAELCMPLADSGIYIVRIGTRTLKVAR